MKYDMKALAHDFWYGKPHQERRLGDLYIDKTGLYKHREWRGFPVPRQAFFSNGGPRLYGMLSTVDYKGGEALKTCHSEFHRITGAASL